MEYASGGELFDRICKNVRFSEDEVCIYSPVTLVQLFVDLFFIKQWWC
jgi:hypothetical protein